MNCKCIKDDVFYYVYKNITDGIILKIKEIDNKIISNKLFGKIAKEALFPIFKRKWERVLILEMNFADEDGLLQGDTENIRFAFFIREVCKQENLSALCEKYPRLWSTWQQEISIFSISLQQFMDRIETDLNVAAKYFHSDNAITRVNDIRMIGDPHRGMQQTARIGYINEEGRSRLLYYKPRSIAIDEGYYNFIAWWNKHSPIDHVLPRTINNGDYGWAEAIVPKECQTAEQVKNFYRRYGSLIALAHLCSSTDLHMENIIACGEYPVLVDLETLFSCTLESERHNPTNNHLYSSLLLPTETLYDELEISALSAQSNVQTNIDILVNPQKRVSSLKMERRKLHTGEYQSQVIFNGNAVDFIQHESDILSGIRETLIFVHENRDEVLRAIRDNIGRAPIRIIKQSTEEYTKILYNCGHPSSLKKDSAAQELLALCDPSRDTNIMESELLELTRGDVPYFSMPFDSSVLLNGFGEKLPTIIHQSPRQKLESQFSRLTPAFIQQVMEDAEQAFLVYRLRKGEKWVARKPIYEDEAQEAVSTEQWIDKLAYFAMSKVMDCALMIDEKINWRTIHIKNDIIHAGLSGIDLYQGISGIALAFHITGQRLSCPRFTEFAGRISDQTIEQLQDTSSAELGALSGTAGTLWSLGVINNARLIKLLPIIDRELSKISYCLLTETVEHYEQIEFVSGIGGTLSMLLRLHQQFRDHPIAEKIARLADFSFNLLKRKAGSLVDDQTTSLGFAHGTAGVSAVLAEYMTYFQQEDDEALSVILRNLERETRYRTELGWPRIGKDNVYSTSWCHGTVGIGYSRLHCRPYIPAETYDSDMAIVTARLGEIRSSHGICHGMMADYYLARTLGLDGMDILHQVRKEVEIAGIRTDFGLSGNEMVGAMTGVTSLFMGDTIFSNKY